MKFKILLLLAGIFLASCSQRNLLYFSSTEIAATSSENFTQSSKRDPKIQPDDLLSITVTSLSPEANILFNKGEVIPVGAGSGYTPTATGSFNDGYLVDNEGFIDFPVLGRIQVAGYTKAETKRLINDQLGRYLKEPVVNIRFLNFRITVVGEVKQPSSFVIPSEKINILEAIGMAGDMTVHGKRENVLLIREEGGAKNLTRINLNSKHLLNSPYFYLQQNDVVYVEPDKVRMGQASNARGNVSLALSAGTLVAIIVSNFIF